MKTRADQVRHGRVLGHVLPWLDIRAFKLCFEKPREEVVILIQKSEFLERDWAGFQEKNAFGWINNK